MAKTITLKVRIKDRHAHQLKLMAGSVNYVWNYINELSSRSIGERGCFLSAYDIDRYTKGANKELGLHSQTLQEVSREYTTRRKQFKKKRLSWRRTRGSRRSLGWIPFKSGAVKWKSGQIFHNGRYYKVWDSYGLSQYSFRSGSFNEDARGRWYINIVVELEEKASQGRSSIGIDLGCKEAATDSTGYKVKGREYRRLEEQLGKAQRANKKKRVRAIHAKIRNRRKDTLHKYSTRLIKENAAIFVGDVSSQKLTKTKLAKSVLDAGWGQLKTMLDYKCAHAGVVFEQIDESNTTQTCSSCGSKPPERPRGIAGLGIREWQCSEWRYQRSQEHSRARARASRWRKGSGVSHPGLGIVMMLRNLLPSGRRGSQNSKH